MENKDKYFYIKWQDSKKQEYKVGILARINDIFYMMCHSDQGNENSAYNNGFNGIPSFEVGKLYRSERELFEFFKNRIIVLNEEDPFDKLKENNAKLLTDSFSVEEIPREKAEQYKNIILEMEENISKNNIDYKRNDKKDELTNHLK